MLKCFFCCLSSLLVFFVKNLPVSKKVRTLLPGFRLLRHSSGNSTKAHGASFEFFNDGKKNFIIHVIESILIYIQCLQ